MSEETTTPVEPTAEADGAAPTAAPEAPAAAAEAPAAAAEAPAAAPATSGGASTADLVAIIGDKSDDEIVALINDFGAETFLGGLFEEMAKRFLPAKASGKTAVIQYDINLPAGTETYQVDVAGGACSASKGATKEATVTLSLSGPDFLRLISGKLNGMQAFMSGKLKLKGDMMLAQTMQGWFDQT